MVYALLLVIFLVVFLRDSLAQPLLGPVPALWSAAGSLGMLLGAWVVGHVLIWREGRRFGGGGNLRPLRRADRIATGVRFAAAAIHAFNVLALGWLDAVRLVVGNVVALDELLAVLPVIAVFALSWWSMFPLENRLREAVILHEMELGRGARQTLPGRGGFVLSALRHQVALVLVPVMLILTWNELVARGAMRFGPPTWLPGAVQIAGLAVVLTMMPAVLRRVWDTAAMGPGPLREQIAGMCRRHRVRIRELLIWRTHGTMVNGAVMGIAWPFRYLLLTDALLEYLHPRQVEAVTAHEVGHVRRRHMPWLVAGAVGSIVLASVALQVGLVWLAGNWLSMDVIGGAAAVGALATAFVMFGFASRRFEWQADAFAAQHLSGYCEAERGEEPVLITAEAVAAMSSALDAVADLNHMRRERFTWRHGSIASRQRRLRALVGMRADRLKADRDAALVKVVSAVGLALAAGLVAVDVLLRAGG
jgi:STE24 endopeptidase